MQNETGDMGIVLYATIELATIEYVKNMAPSRKMGECFLQRYKYGRWD